MKVCLGGTFDILHEGHKQLIATACDLAGASGAVVIGVTKGSMALKRPRINSYQHRIKAIEKFIKEKNLKTNVKITPIRDKYGPSLEEDFDAIVVSPETKPVADEINEKRKRRGKKPLQVVVVPFVLAQNGKPISSTLIRNGEMDDSGTLLGKE